MVNVPVDVLFCWPERSGGELMTLIPFHVKSGEWYRRLLCFQGDQGTPKYISLNISLRRSTSNALDPWAMGNHHWVISHLHLLTSGCPNYESISSNLNLHQSRVNCRINCTSGTRDEAVTPQLVWLTSYIYSNNGSSISEEGSPWCPSILRTVHHRVVCRNVPPRCQNGTTYNIVNITWLSRNNTFSVLIFLSPDKKRWSRVSICIQLNYFLAPLRHKHSCGFSGSTGIQLVCSWPLSGPTVTCIPADPRPPLSCL